jgi:MFS family permease
VIELPEWLRGERPRPELSALVGAAGGLVVLAGMFALFEELESDSVRVGGLALSLFTLLLGLFLMVLEPRGALRNAGVTLAAGAGAPLAFFLVNDPEKVVGKGDVVVAALATVVVWALLFALSPARGHGLFLGLALFGLWFGAVFQTSPQSLFFPFSAVVEATATEPDVPTVEVVPPVVSIPGIPQRPVPPFTIPEPPEREVVPIPEPSTETIPFPIFEFPEPPQVQEQSIDTTLLSATSDGEEPDPPIAPAVVSILFGVLYLLGAAALDWLRLARLASAVIAVGTPVLAFGVAFVGPRHGGTAVGVGAVALGLFLLAIGIGGEGRRFSAWAGAAVLAGGAVGAVAESFEGPGSGDAVALLVVGAALVAAGWLVSDLQGNGGPVREPPQTPQ